MGAGGGGRGGEQTKPEPACSKKKTGAMRAGTARGATAMAGGPPTATRAGCRAAGRSAFAGKGKAIGGRE